MKLQASILTVLALGGCSGGGDAPPAQASAARAHANVASIAAAAAQATVPGYRDQYTLSMLASGTVRVTDKLSGQAQVFADIGALAFFDASTVFDLDGVEAKVYRLYQAAFNRKPDPEGLGFWIQAARAGVSLPDIAAGFIASAEFGAQYGAGSTAAEFIARLYDNILHRAPEPAGYAWWVQQVDAGVARADALLAFSDSAENRAGLLPAMADGVDFALPRTAGRIIPKRTSYLNAKGIGMAPQHLPVVDLASGEGIQHAYAFGDFFQDGSLSLVAFTEFTPLDGSWPPVRQGVVRFYRKAADGQWIEHTGALLADTSGCILPRKLAVADFNNDGAPDVFAACSGLDVPPYGGENYRVLLSQKDGSYRNERLAVAGYAHGASAADVNGDGAVDVVVADMRGQGGRTPLYFLMGDGKGGFSTDYERAARPEFAYKTAFWTVELLQDGSKGTRLFAGGTEPYRMPNGEAGGSTDTVLLAADANGRFVDGRKTVLPAAPGYESVMDVIVEGDTAWVLRVMSEPAYGGTAIQRVGLAAGTSTLVYSHTGWYPGKYLNFASTWFAWMIPYQQGIESLNAFYQVRVERK